MRLIMILVILFALFFVGCKVSSYDYIGEDLFLITSDGVRLSAIYTPAEQPRVAAILIHDADTTKEAWENITSALVQYNVSTLAFDMRGYGTSEGTVDYLAVKKDIAAAKEFLLAKGESPTVLIGSNVGSHIALLYALEDTSIQKVLAYGMRRDWQGLEITEEVLEAYHNELYLFAARAQNDHWEETTAIKEYYTGPKKYRLYTGSYDGFRMIHQNFQDAMELSLTWIYREA